MVLITLKCLCVVLLGLFCFILFVGICWAVVSLIKIAIAVNALKEIFDPLTVSEYIEDSEQHMKKLERIYKKAHRIR